MYSVVDPPLTVSCRTVAAHAVLTRATPSIRRPQRNSHNGFASGIVWGHPGASVFPPRLARPGIRTIQRRMPSSLCKAACDAHRFSLWRWADQQTGRLHELTFRRALGIGGVSTRGPGRVRRQSLNLSRDVTLCHARRQTKRLPQGLTRCGLATTRPSPPDGCTPLLRTAISQR